MKKYILLTSFVFCVMITYAQTPSMLGTYIFKSNHPTCLYDHIVIERTPSGKIECCRRYRFSTGNEIEEQYKVISFSEQKKTITVEYQGCQATYTFHKKGDKYLLDVYQGVLVYSKGD